MKFSSFQDLSVKFEECNDVLLEFNNISSDLQKLVKSEDENAKEIEKDTAEVNFEFTKRRNRLRFHEKLIKGFHRTLCGFKNTVSDINEWCDEQTKEINKVDENVKDTKTAKTAKTEIMKIDVSCFCHYIHIHTYICIYICVFVCVCVCV